MIQSLSLASMLLILLFCLSVNGQTTAFTYQGRISDGGNPANGNFQMQFKLFDAVSGGTQIGPTLNDVAVTAANGVFSAQLDFGSAPFSGADRWLEVAVRRNSGESYVALAPRTQLLPAPYAVRSLNSAAADGLAASCVGCVTSGQIASVNGSAVTGTIPVVSVPAGSANYIQNTTSQQGATNFNIGGNGTAGGVLSGNVVNAATQFNLGGSRILSSPGNNLFAGTVAGEANTTGNSNAFFGSEAGRRNTTGFANAFFGTGAGNETTTGSRNAFFGTNAGGSNTTSFDNAFFGYFAGLNNTTSSKNAFFGGWSGYANTIGENNTFIGFQAGQTHTTGNFNTIVGAGADFSNISPPGNYNTMLGYGISIASGVSNATAIGANAVAGLNNTLILGPIPGINGVTDRVNVGIGTVNPVYRLDVVGGVRSFDSGSTHFVVETTGGTNSWARIFMRTPNRGWFIGTSRGFLDDQFHIWDETANQPRVAITTGGDIGIGTVTPAARLHIQGNVFVSGVVTQGSDVRLKQNISKLGYGLSEVLRLRPVSWRWKTHPESGEQLGLVAQEVERVLPELVSTSKDAEQTKGLNYVGLVPILVNAVKEQQQQLDEQARLAKELQQKIERQGRVIKLQQDQLADLKALVCLRAKMAAQCR